MNYLALSLLLIPVVTVLLLVWVTWDKGDIPCYKNTEHLENNTREEKDND